MAGAAFFRTRSGSPHHGIRPGRSFSDHSNNSGGARVTGKRAKSSNMYLSRATRTWIHGIALAVLPILTAIGMVTEEMALLYGTLIGTILVPWIGLNDQVVADENELEAYHEGLVEGKSTSGI